MKKILLIFFLAGIAYRIWIASLVPQPFAYDQAEYQFYAEQILEKGLTAWTARLYGYPLFMAIIYKLFGLNNFALTVSQAVLDSFTGLLIYFTAKNLFEKKEIAVSAFLLYIFNPFTSTLVTLGLTEILAVFLMCAAGLMIVILASRISKPIFFALGLILGFLPQVRPSFLYYSFILGTIACIYFIGKVKNKVAAFFVYVLLFFLPFFYTVAGNLVYYNQFSLTTVDNLFSRELYTSLYLPLQFYISDEDKIVYPPEVLTVYQEYSTNPKNQKERELMAGKYLDLSFQKIKSNPLMFVVTRIKQMWFVWEKHYLYVYNNPKNSYVNFLTYWGNNLLLALAVTGLIFTRLIKGSFALNIFFRFTVFTFFYISVVHAFSYSERYSLPAYPIVFLFAGYALWNLKKGIKQINYST